MIMAKVEQTIPVRGMSCDGCERAVEKALGAVPGVIRAKASHRQAQVQVVYDDGKTQLEPLRQAIVRAGYRVE